MHRVNILHNAGDAKCGASLWRTRSCGAIQAAEKRRECMNIQGSAAGPAGAPAIRAGIRGSGDSEAAAD
jgi:hypothetical protein